MNQPSLDKLMERVDSKYALVVAAAKRARVLTQADSPQFRFTKPVTVALHEIAEGKVKVESYKSGIK